MSFWVTGRDAFEIYLSPHDNLFAPGNLHIQVEAQGGRGNVIPDYDQPVTDEQADQANEVVTQVVEKYFT